MLRSLLVALPLCALVALACGSSENSSSSSGGTADGGTTNDGGGTDGGGTSAPSLCPATRAYVIKCAGEGDLNCGPDKYDAWCAANDTKVNSDAFRRAETKCLTTVACEADARKECDYKSYGSETPTAAQKKLVEAYCATCEPSDTQACATRSITYDAAGGPSKVTDIFIAAWELADPIVDQIREQCTGSALENDASADPCEKRFSSCAAGPYLDAVPDCAP